MDLTNEGLKKLEQELEELKTTKRKEIAERLRRAISYGDLSENADYHNAREEQDFLEHRIEELQDRMRNATVLAPKGKDGTVQVGSKVLLENSGEQFSFVITDPQLANPLEGKISSESPLGQALLGKQQGDTVEVATPSGNVQYKILTIA